jgi:hypothetical protein
MKRSLCIALVSAVTLTLLGMGQPLYAQVKPQPSAPQRLGAAPPTPPCCSVTAIDSRSGIVTAKVTVTGATFQFKETSGTLPTTLHAGSPVYANLNTKQVSLDGNTVCCVIISGPSAPAAPAPPVGQPPTARQPVVTPSAPQAAKSPIGGSADSRPSASPVPVARPPGSLTQEIDPCMIASADVLKVLLQGGIQRYFPYPVNNGGEHISISNPNIEQVTCPNMTIKVHADFQYRETRGFPQFQTGGSMELQSSLVVEVTEGGLEMVNAPTPASNVVRAVAVLTNPRITSLQVTNIPGWLDLTWVADCLNGKYSNWGCTDVLHAMSFDVTALVKLYLRQGHTLPAAPAATTRVVGQLRNLLPTPCCPITAMDASTGIATAIVNATRKTFQFQVRDSELFNSIKVGQGVYANFSTKQVSLDGKTECCWIINNDLAASTFLHDIAPVMLSSRCVNCHAAGDTPTQGDDRHVHAPPVTRQTDCQQCHGNSNGATLGSAPGEPNWRMAPFVFAGKEMAQLCLQI